MDRPIFLAGTHRSGTTLLRLILDSHPNVAIPEETGFMRAVEATQVIPGWKSGPGWYHRLGIDDAEFDERLRRFYGELFEQHAIRQGKNRWGEKTPFHVWHLDQIDRLFPDAVFVGIVRHPAAVVNSLINRWNYGLDEAIAQWRDMNLTMLAHGVRCGPRFALCRYEDLVYAPEATIRTLLAFLQEPWSDSVLRHHTAQDEQGAPRVVDGGTRPRDPIDAARAAGWTDMLEEAQMDLIEQRVGDLASFLGYVVRSASDLRGLCATEPASEPRVIRGDELESLRSQHPGAPATFAATTGPSAGLLRELTREELEIRLTRTETALARLQSRRAVQLGNAIRRVQRANSFAEVREAVTGLRLRKYR